MTTKKTTKTTKKQTNKRTIEVNPLDLLMICTGEPKESRTERLNEVLEENPKHKVAQEAKEKLIDFAKIMAEKKKAADERCYKVLKPMFKNVILQTHFDLKKARHYLAFYEFATGNITAEEYEWFREHEKELIEECKIDVHNLLHAIQNIEAKSNLKTLKDFKFRLFKTCVEHFTHKGGDTTRKVIFKDEITNPNEIIPDNGTVFTVDIHDKQIDVIVFGKDYEKIVVAENVVDTVLPQQKPGNIE